MGHETKEGAYFCVRFPRYTCEYFELLAASFTTIFCHFFQSLNFFDSESDRVTTSRRPIDDYTYASVLKNKNRRRGTACIAESTTTVRNGNVYENGTISVT